jgi:hypothetical protein
MQLTSSTILSFSYIYKPLVEYIITKEKKKETTQKISKKTD